MGVVYRSSPIRLHRLAESSSVSIPTVDPVPNRLASWSQLVRLPNVFTVIADVSAAFMLVAHGPTPVTRFIVVVLAGITLYWAGMILNDVFDREKDAVERPSRPIPSGQVSLKHASGAGWGLLVLGVALATASGFVPAVDRAGIDYPATLVPGIVAVVLAVLIVLYDGPLKKTPLAAVAMGGCRVLSFLLGASPVVVLDEGMFPKYLLGIALGFGTYIMGITTMARREATGGRSPHLVNGLVVTVVGSALLAFAPRLAERPMDWHVPAVDMFPLLIGMIALPVVLRGIRLLGDPSPGKIQATIRAGILSMIPLAAAFAFLGAGPTWGLVVFALVVPAIVLSMRLRVT